MFCKRIKTPRTEIAIIEYDNSFSLILRFRLTPWQQFCRENKKIVASFDKRHEFDEQTQEYGRYR